MKSFARLTALTIMLQLLTLSITYAHVGSILLDSTFGTQGVVTNIYNAQYPNAPSSMDVQVDGKIVQGVVGYGSAAVRRFFANGALDTTFGVAGYALLNRYPNCSSMASVKVMHDGKILACAGPAQNTGAFVARFTPAGVLDSTFGTSGYTSFGSLVNPDIGGYADIMVLSDSSIRLVFTNYGNVRDTALIIKLTSDGVVDNTFGVAGEVAVNHAVFTGCSFILDHSDRLVMSTPLQSGLLIGRILPNGSMDNSFGNNGFNVILPDTIQTAQLRLISTIPVALPDNSVVLLLNYSNVSHFSFAIHTRADGTQDMSYGLNGLASVNLFWTATMTAGLALDNGGLLISGQSIIQSTFNTYAGEFVMLNTAGKVDTVFANHRAYSYIEYDTNYAGSQYTTVGPAILLPGSQIMQAGSTRQFFTWLSRYNYSGFISGVSEVESDNDFVVYPNPANSNVVLRFHSFSAEMVRLSVYDITRKLVFEKMIPGGIDMYQFEPRGWSAGLYFVEMNRGDNISTRKLMVQH